MADARCLSQGNNVTGAVHLDSLQLALLWSHIGDFHMGLIQVRRGHRQSRHM